MSGNNENNEPYAGRIVTFNSNCPECGPDGTNPIQSDYDQWTKPPCATCREAMYDSIRDVGRRIAEAQESAVFDRICGDGSDIQVTK